jgi:hypothetical protein
MSIGSFAEYILNLSEDESDFLFYGHENFGEPRLDIYYDDSNNITEAINRLNILINRLL